MARTRFGSRIHVFINMEGVLTRQGAGLRLFHADDSASFWCWAPPMAALAERFDAALVVRSSWTLQAPLDEIVAVMPRGLATRVVGATDPLAELTFSGARRIASQYQVIRRYVRRHRLTRWMAVDDREEGWPQSERWRLALCRSRYGLSEPATLAHIEQTLLKIGGSRSGVIGPA